jgi:glycosyltransferase involved in cell wall biosynthesis
MRVSVVLCTHTLDRYEHLREAARSVQRGTYDDWELVLVSDGNPAVAERMRADFADERAAGDAVVHENDENLGLLGARNNGARVASGDVVAFLDDDAVADERWLELLVDRYEERDPTPAAVGGRMVPAWVAGKPDFLPVEFYWLVGVTHRGFGPGGGWDGWTTEGEVRNTMGSNISFRAEVFESLDGFETDIGGRKGDNHLQGGETELCARMRAEYDEGVWYVPEAEVAHKVFDYRTEPRWLLERAFWQGYSKRGMEHFVPESAGEEDAFLSDLLTEFVPRRLRSLVRRPAAAKLSQLVFLALFTAFVGFGYGYGATKWR